MRIGGEASASNNAFRIEGLDFDGVGRRANTASVQGLHVEDVDALHATQELVALQASGLLSVARDGLRVLRARTVELGRTVMVAGETTRRRSKAAEGGGARGGLGDSHDRWADGVEGAEHGERRCHAINGADATFQFKLSFSL